MGHSVCRMVLPGVTASWVLAMARAYADRKGLRVDAASPVHLALRKGSIWWTGRRWIRVGAQDVPGGAAIVVEAWVEGTFGDMTADPSQFLGWLPRRDACDLAVGLLAALGVAGAERLLLHGAL